MINMLLVVNGIRMREIRTPDAPPRVAPLSSGHTLPEWTAVPPLVVMVLLLPPLSQSPQLTDWALLSSQSTLLRSARRRAAWCHLVQRPLYRLFREVESICENDTRSRLNVIEGNQDGNM